MVDFGIWGSVVVVVVVASIVFLSVFIRGCGTIESS